MHTNKNAEHWSQKELEWEMHVDDPGAIMTPAAPNLGAIRQGCMAWRGIESRGLRSGSTLLRVATEDEFAHYDSQRAAAVLSFDFNRRNKRLLHKIRAEQDLENRRLKQCPMVPAKPPPTEGEQKSSKGRGRPKGKAKGKPMKGSNK